LRKPVNREHALLEYTYLIQNIREYDVGKLQVFNLVYNSLKQVPLLALGIDLNQ